MICELIHKYKFLNIFKYITCRVGVSMFTAFLVVILLMPKFIKKLKSINAVQQIRVDGPQTHLAKKGTPTMGGLLMNCAIIVSVLLWTNLKNAYIWILIITNLLFTFIGFIDDYAKLRKKKCYWI